MQLNALQLSALATLFAQALATDGVVRIDFQVNRDEVSVERSRLNARGEPITETIINNRGSYLAKLIIGSDNQAINVNMDTGSSSLWVPGPNTRKIADGNFNPATSTSFHNNGTKFQILYGSGHGALGEWSQDSVTLGGVTLKNANIAVVSRLSDSIAKGILGLGLTGPGLSSKVDNFPAQLARSGLINKNVYSIYLDSLLAKTGTVLFGGVDSEKYTGPLAGQPIVSTTLIQVNLQGIQVAGLVIPTCSTPVTLDTGTTFSYLPAQMVDAIAAYLGLTFDTSDQYYYGTTPSYLPSDTVSFAFNGVLIEVPIKNLLSLQKGGKGYRLDIGYPLGGTLGVLGENFLRSAYMVADLDDKNVYLAQAKLGSTALNVIPVVSSIPGGIL